MTQLLAYNTNGFAHHRLADAIDLIADTGYRAVAITLDVHALNPADADLAAQTVTVRNQLQRRNLACTIETGGRFVLDARRKHWPTLVSGDADDRRRRLRFLQSAIDIAADLEAAAVSFWSGALEAGASPEAASSHLAEGCATLLKHGERRGVRLALEPEPGMLIETCDHFAELCRRLGDGQLGLALDVGHVHCLRDGEPAGRIRQFADRLRVVHIEDMRAGVHEHLMFGAGEMRFPPIIAALRDSGYTGPLVVELSRHSHDAVNAARRAFEFLSPMLA